MESPQGITNIASLPTGMFITPKKFISSPLYAGSLSLLHPLFLFERYD